MTSLLLTERLARLAADRPFARAFGFRSGAGPDVWQTWSALGGSARDIARRLAACPAGPAAIVTPPGLETVQALFGALSAARPVTLLPEPRAGAPAPLLAAAVADLGPAVLLTTRALAPRLSALGLGPPVLALEDLPAGGAAPRPPRPEDVALVQYTSGATGDPKGVAVDHGGLASHCRRIADAFRLGGEDVQVSWLPHTHDMGLIGGLLTPLMEGVPTLILPPLNTMARPETWLGAISDLGATISGGPPFGYDSAVRRAAPHRRPGLDLSRWRIAFVGAEPVATDALVRFARHYEDAGFSAKAFLPCYGLAEAILMAACQSPGAPELASPVDGIAPAGRALPGGDILIVDPLGRILPDGAEGEIWLAGAGRALGYWRRPQASAQAFAARTADGCGPCLRTGDLGRMDAGVLTITGRIKDLIIRAGRNFHPEDMERAAADALPEIDPRAFAVIEDAAGAVALVIDLALAPGRSPPSPADLARARAHVGAATGLSPSTTRLIEDWRLPRTSSGKLRRRAIAARLAADGAVPAAPDAAPQPGRLTGTNPIAPGTSG